MARAAAQEERSRAQRIAARLFAGPHGSRLASPCLLSGCPWTTSPPMDTRLAEAYVSSTNPLWESSEYMVLLHTF